MAVEVDLDDVTPETTLATVKPTAADRR